MPSETPANPLPPDRERLEETYHRLRGSIHSLGLCMKVMATRADPYDMDRCAAQIEQIATEIEQLLLGLQPEALQS
jgi:hypothetical protein